MEVVAKPSDGANGILTNPYVCFVLALEHGVASSPGCEFHVSKAAVYIAHVHLHVAIFPM